MLTKELTNYLEDQFGKIKNTKTLSTVNNIVYRVTTTSGTYVIKFYTNRGLHKDIDMWVWRHVESFPFAHPIIEFDDTKELSEFDYAIFKYHEGTNLLELIKRGDVKNFDLAHIGKQIADFLKLITSYKIEGCGLINEQGNTSHENWFSFILDYQPPTMQTLLEKNIDRELLKKVYAKLIDNYELFIGTTYSLCPIDLNLSNFLITHSGDLIFLDMGGMIGGTLQFALGEFSSHTFKTPLHQVVFDHFSLSDTDMMRIHLYAITMNLNVLAFVLKHGLSDINSAKPWGNNETFLNLVIERFKILEDMQRNLYT